MNHYRVSRAVHPLVFIFLFLKGQAQTVRPLYAGTKTPYVQPQQKYTAPPKGFHAVFVNYVGRHGARFMTKSGADRQALEMLEEADREHALSDTGRLIKRSVEKMLSIQKTGYEKITLLGAMEQTAIGERIYDHYQTAFSGRGIKVQYTFKTRTQQSAEAFLMAYRKYPGIITTEKNTDSANTELRFYDLSPAYTNYKNGSDIRRSLDSLNADPTEEQMVKRVCLKLFTISYAEHLISDRKASRIVENLYDLYTATFAVKNEMKDRGFTT
ncbi:MAG TPA: histidine-type phosphatase, partial [Puia sp.]|nr:histidine-type phosphatase [Puia sp.]